ncbi:C1QL3-like protein [Mya arenaria]|nr:C1QL3-like protein [Mya arenaria]
MTNEAIKFDRILLNEGNGYNAYTGAFTAPVTGIYLFSYHFDSTKTTFVRLVVNGVNEVDGVANAHVVSGARQAQSMGGNTCIIQVVRGQAVLVEVFEVPDATINSKLENKENSLMDILLELKREVSALHKDIENLTIENVLQETTIKDLKHKIEELEHKHAAQNMESQKAPSREDKDDDSIRSGENINHDAPTTPRLPPWLLSRQRRAVGNAAFSVYLSQSKQHMTNEAIKFDRILLNDGNVYNTFTGAFTAPLSGVYLFTYHFDSTTSTFVRLVVNGVNEVDAVANPHVVSGPRQAQSMGGNTCIIHVSHGQAVQVQVFEIPDATIDSSDNFHFSTFSGVLLY